METDVDARICVSEMFFGIAFSVQVMSRSSVATFWLAERLR